MSKPLFRPIPIFDVHPGERLLEGTVEGGVREIVRAWVDQFRYQYPSDKLMAEAFDEPHIEAKSVARIEEAHKSAEAVLQIYEKHTQRAYKEMMDHPDENVRRLARAAKTGDTEPISIYGGRE